MSAIIIVIKIGLSMPPCLGPSLIVNLSDSEFSVRHIIYGTYGMVLIIISYIPLFKLLNIKFLAYHMLFQYLERY